jgi:carbamate kinase
MTLFQNKKRKNDDNTANRYSRIVVAVGGNALQRRGEKLSYENQLNAAMEAIPSIKSISENHQLILTHGNGPQVGVLASERKNVTFDVLGAESQGQIGYVFSQALGTVGKIAVPIITQVRVDCSDGAFHNPTKYVGAVYDKTEAEYLEKNNRWIMKKDGEYWRRVVASPSPLQIIQLNAISALLESNDCKPPMKMIPIVCGGGGSPIKYDESGAIKGVDAVIDKDYCGALLANEIDADIFIILTDGGGIYENFGKPDQREMAEVTPEYLVNTKAGKNFPGSMGPKIQAVINFVQRSSRDDVYAVIGDLRDTEEILLLNAGTIIKKNVDGGVKWRSKK